MLQGYLHITCCDFAVWTLTLTATEFSVECIRVDHQLWNDTMFPKLFCFYMGSMLPEWNRSCHATGQPVRELVSFWNHDDLQPSNN